MLPYKNMTLIDANVILRYLLNDNPEMARQAREIIEGGTGAYTKAEIIAEVVYVLKGVYQAERRDIRIYIQELLKAVRCSEGDVVIYATDLYADTSLDFVDCLLAAYHAVNKETVFTFHKKLNRYLS